MSATLAFTGPNLSNKRKEELTLIATALQLPGVETARRESLIKEVRAHLVLHRDTLSIDPRFSGLYPSVRVRKVPAKLTLEGEEEEEETDSPVVGVVTRRAAKATSPELIPLPPSVTTSPNGRALEAAIERAEAKEAAEVVAGPGEIVVAAPSQLALIAKGNAVAFDWRTTPLEWLELARTNLSDENVIAYITVAVEMLWFLSNVVPVTYYPLAVPSLKTAPPPSDAATIVVPTSTKVAFPIPHPTLATAQALFAWALPTLILPHLLGSLISLSKPRKSLDPITVAVVRLACVWAMGDAGGVPVNARIAGALVSLAFAFANAIYEAGTSETTTIIV